MNPITTDSLPPQQTSYSSTQPSTPYLPQSVPTQAQATQQEFKNYIQTLIGHLIADVKTQLPKEKPKFSFSSFFNFRDEQHDTISTISDAINKHLDDLSEANADDSFNAQPIKNILYLYFGKIQTLLSDINSFISEREKTPIDSKLEWLLSIQGYVSKNTAWLHAALNDNLTQLNSQTTHNVSSDTVNQNETAAACTAANITPDQNQTHATEIPIPHYFSKPVLLVDFDSTLKHKNYGINGNLLNAIAKYKFNEIIIFTDMCIDGFNQVDTVTEREELKADAEKSYKNTINKLTKVVTPADVFWSAPQQEITAFFKMISDSQNKKLFTFNKPKDQATKEKETLFLQENCRHINTILQMISGKIPVDHAKLANPGQAFADMNQLFQEHKSVIADCLTNGHKSLIPNIVTENMQRQYVCKILTDYAAEVNNLVHSKGIMFWYLCQKMKSLSYVFADDLLDCLSSTSEMVSRLYNENHPIELSTILVKMHDQKLTEDYYRYCEFLDKVITKNLLRDRLEFLSHIAKYTQDALKLKLMLQNPQPITISSKDVPSAGKIGQLCQQFIKNGILKINPSEPSTQPQHDPILYSSYPHC